MSNLVLPVSVLGLVSAGDAICSTLIADTGSSATRLYPFNGLVEGERIDKIKPGMHKACSDPESDDCEDYLETLKTDLESGKAQCPSVKSIYLLGTAGMRSLPDAISDQVWAKVSAKVQEVGFPDSVTVEARNLSGAEEAKNEYIALIAALEASNSLQEGKQGVLGLGGRSFQFGLQTSDTDISVESHEIGQNKMWSEIDSSKCAFGTGDGAACKAEIESNYMESVEDALNAAGNTPTADEWRDANLFGIQNFFYTVDFLRYKKLIDESASSITAKELEDAAVKLCKMTRAEAEAQVGEEMHPYSSKWDYMEKRCFGATYIAYLLRKLHVPEDKSINFLNIDAGWTQGYVRTKAGTLPKSLEKLDDLLSGAFNHGLTAVLLTVLAVA